MDSEQLAEVLRTFQQQQENFLKTLFQQNPAQQQSQLASTTINVTHIPPFESYVSSKENFRYYCERFENYLRMKEVFTDKKKSAQLLVLSIGAETYNLLSALLALKTPNDANYDELIDLLEKHLSPERNELVAQHQFLNIYQSNENSIAEFIAELRRNLAACKFEITCSCSETNSIADLLLRIQFIRGLRDSSITEQILQSELKEFSLITSKAIALEAAKNDSKTLSKQQTSSSVTGINQTTHMNPSFNQQSRRQNQPTNRSARNRTPSKFSRGRSQQKFPRTPSTRRNRVDFSKLGIDGLCLHCGNKNHATRECRTDPRKLKCASCEKTGHLAKVCITTLGKKKSDTTQVNEISNLDLEYGLHQIANVYNQSTAATEKYYATVTIQDTQLNFEVDSGAGYAMIPEEMFNQLKTKPTIMPTTIRFRAYTPNIFQPLGKCCVNVTYKNRSSFEEFYIVPTGYDALLGRACIRHLRINLQELDLEKANQQMVNKVNDVSEFKTMFPRVFEQKIGCVPDIEIHLQLREGAKPVYIAARSVPYALRDKVERELDLLEAAEIITKSPTSDWGSPLVVVIKADNTARLCVNYKIAVNDLLVNSNYPIKRIEDVLNSLRNSRYFCRLDLYKAYLHLKVDEESSKIQTAATHRGTYRINRLSFGIKTAPAEINRVMDIVLRNLQNTIAYFDDIIVHGPTLQNCEENLIECLRRLEKNDLHLNLSKCTFFQTEIEYLGYLIKYNTIGKSPKKVEAILLLPEPTNVADVRHFLGLITYYSRFIPDASTLTAPLRRILQKNKMFRWTSNCKIAFKNLKNEIASDRVVVPYDPSLPVVLMTDASPVGLGAILSHVEATSEKPIAFASRSLTAAEKNYSQLDKEALAIVFGISHFSEYLFGKRPDRDTT